MNELTSIRLVTFCEQGTLRYRHAAPDRVWYPDTDQLAELSKSCLLGCVSTDPAASLQTSAHLNVLWDVYLHAGHAKLLQTEEFWTKAQKSMQSTLGIAKDQWLHVTGNHDGEIEILQKLGLKTALIPRNDGSAAMAAQLSNVPLLISDLTQLQYGISTAKSAPVCFRVTATATHKKVADAYVNWMRREHGPDLLKQNGCQEYRVMRVNSEVNVCEYIFTSRGLLDYYVEHHAPALRAKGKELLPEHLMKFDREIYVVEAYGAARSVRDFV